MHAQAISAIYSDSAQSQQLTLSAFKCCALRSHPCNKSPLSKQAFLFPRERDVSTWAQGGTSTRSRRGSPLNPTAHLFVPRPRGQQALPVSALLQLCRVILPARPRTSFGYVHPGRNCHCPAGVITGPSKCLFF